MRRPLLLPEGATPMSLVATVERMERGAVVVTPVGELDAYTAPELREQLHGFAGTRASTCSSSTSAGSRSSTRVRSACS